jgi:hypothetical protein
MTAARDILVTIPRVFDRADVVSQLSRCRNGVAWHYCTNRLPSKQPGRMHFIHSAELIGSLPIIDQGVFDGRKLVRADGSFLQQPRKFAIRAAGEFTPPAHAQQIRGFQGWRYFEALCPECGGVGSIVRPGGVTTSCPACGGEE